MILNTKVVPAPTTSTADFVRQLLLQRLQQEPAMDFAANEAAAAALTQQLTELVASTLARINCEATAELLVARIEHGQFPQVLADVREALALKDGEWPELSDTLARATLNPPGVIAIAAILGNATPEAVKELYRRTPIGCVDAFVHSSRALQQSGGEWR